MNALSRLFAGLVLAGAGVAAQAHGYQLGDMTIGHPYARSTVPGQPSGGAYMRLENHGADDRLISASTAVASQVELHTSTLEGDVMHMRQIDAIDVPANKPVVLQPGGTHLMLLGLKAPLKAGQSFPMMLKFEKAGEVTVQVTVQDAAAKR